MLVAVDKKGQRQRVHIAIEVCDPRVPHQNRILTCNFSRNGFMTVQPSSSMEMPITTSPASRYFSESSIIQGIEFLHGVHQVAQKSSSTTLPA